MSVDGDRYLRWVDRYVSAWNSNDPAEIGELFGEDAEYWTEPYASPWHGRDEIVREWLKIKDEPGTTTFDYDLLISNDELGVVKGHTVYTTDGRHYDNIWEIRFDDDGRCRQFVEWWMKRPR
jgi:ketosteroid isomerase-like protein